MQLFEFVNNRVTFAPQALEIKVFKALWDRDTSKKKEKANAELAFIYFYADYKSIYADIIDDEERAHEIYKTLSMVELPDTKVYEGCDYYMERQNTISMGLLRSARKAVKKIEDYFNEVDFTEVNEKGMLKHDITKGANLLGNIAKITQNLASLEDQVQKELEETGDMKGQRKKNLFEDGFEGD